MGGHHRRCLALLRGSGLLGDPRFLFLGAKCLAAAGDWEDCVAMLGGWDAPEPSDEDLQVRIHARDSWGPARLL